MSLYHTANDFYEALIEELEKAQDYILMEYYLIRNDSIAFQVMDVLARKAEEGVRVYVLLDNFGCTAHRERHGQGLKAFKDEYLEAYGNRGVTIAFYNKGKLIPRDHRKLTIIDGKVAFTGGMNITAEYKFFYKGVKYDDLHSKIVGPAVAEFIPGFLYYWGICGMPEIEIPNYTPSAIDDGGRVMLLQTEGMGNEPTAVQMITDFIDSVSDTLRIMNPYWIPDKKIKRSLLDAASRGVSIKILLSTTSDFPFFVDWCLKILAKIALANPQKFEILVYQGGFLHGKAMSADGHLLLIGSHNIDILSRAINHEMSVLADDPQITSEFDRVFEEYGRN